MKNVRQQTILNIIKNKEIETQDELSEELISHGFKVTQATVSRDIKELQLHKAMSSKTGKYRYVSADKKTSDRLTNILTESVVSVASSGNLVVIKTISASANGACEAIDSLQWEEVLGTLAGENTILLVIRSAEEVSTVVERVKELIR